MVDVEQRGGEPETIDDVLVGPEGSLFTSEEIETAQVAHDKFEKGTPVTYNPKKNGSSHSPLANPIVIEYKLAKASENYKS